MTVSLKHPKKSIEILHVEDNPGDALLMREVLKTSKFPINFTLARDGEKALEMLKDSKAFSGHGAPDLILMDLRLPGLNGHEVLAEIRKESKLKEVPIIVMSSSHNDQDLRVAYQNQANFYIVKPVDMTHFANVLAYIENFWLSRIPC